MAPAEEAGNRGVVMAASRLELNLVRLLCRCEAMAAEKRDPDEWRLEKVREARVSAYSPNPGGWSPQPEATGPDSPTPPANEATPLPVGSATSVCAAPPPPPWGPAGPASLILGSSRSSPAPDLAPPLGGFNPFEPDGGGGHWADTPLFVPSMWEPSRTCCRP